MKKAPGDIILLYMCTIKEDHRIYGSSDMFFDIFGSFLPFSPPKNQKVEKMKKNGDLIILHACTTNEDNIIFMMYGF